MNLLNQAKICFGKVIHQRTTPKSHAFSYSVYSLRIPMRSRRVDPKVLSNVGIGDNKFSWIAFYDRDHGTGGEDSLAWAEEILRKSNIHGVDGEIWLHTFPRILGYVFNPVSFWFCHQSNGELKVIIAEVNNTFGERHCYLLSEENQNGLSFGKTLTAKKQFHVSPFFDLDGIYRFRFMRQDTANRSRHVSRIEYIRQGQPALNTSINGTEYDITFKQRWQAILCFPLMTFGIIFKIHWQALLLWKKGIKFHKKPNPPSANIS